MYIPISKRKLSYLKKANCLRWILGLGFVQNFLKKKATKQKGPNEDQRKHSVTNVWGEVKNAKGESKVARITTANGYALTIRGSLTVVDFLLKNQLKCGYSTPSQLMGADLINKFPGSKMVIWDS